MPEYEHKFNELSWFAPELIPIEEEKCRHFEKGLWLDIQAVVTATTYPSMRALSAGFARRPRDASGFRVHQRGADPTPVQQAVDGSEVMDLDLVVGDLGLGQLGVSILGSSRWQYG